MFKRLVKKLKNEKLHPYMSSPIKDDTESLALRKMSKHALELYDRQVDINNFKKLALSDPENKSHNEIVDKLFSKQGINNPFSDEALKNLSNNQKFLKDLGIK